MAIIYLAYLFNDSEFYNTISPIIPELERGNYQPLYGLAKQTMEANPELWSLLDNFFLGPPFAEEDEKPSPRRLLMMVLAQFLKPITAFSPNTGWKFLEIALPMIGWSEKDAKLLLFGKSLCTLLIPKKAYDLEEYKNRPHDLPWCSGYANWLDITTVEQLLYQLIQAREAYMTLSKKPHWLQEKMPLTKNGIELSLNWYSKSLVKAYDDMIKMLTIAKEAHSSIAIAIV